MSRNPYLAASRPTSSFTRSSRSSKRSDLSSSKGSLLGRSRSSASLISGLSSQLGSTSLYSSASGYVPSSSAWQRSLSSSRQNKSSIEQSPLSSKTDTYAPLNQSEKWRDSPGTPLSKSSTYSILNEKVDDVEYQHDNHLKNYQQSKLQQPSQSTRSRSSLLSINSESSLDTRPSTTSPSCATDSSFNNQDDITTNDDESNHPKQGLLLKSKSLDITQQEPEVTSFLSGTMSVDRLILRSESMSDKDLRKYFKELVMENERLKKELKSIDDQERHKQQDWIRKERQLQRKISELEEENRQLEQWRQEIQRLKDENRSLIRVVSKLSKQN